jgi:hypothetical protein
VLCRVLFHNFDRFLSSYERRFEKEYKAVTGETLVPGIVVAVQTFGDRINLPASTCVCISW